MTEQIINNESYSYTIRQTPVLLVLRVILSEFIIMVLHFTLRLTIEYLLNYFQATISIPILTIEVILVQLLNLYLLLTVVLNWVNELYILNPKEIVIKKGAINTRSITYELANLQSMSITQNLLQKIFNFGTIKLFNPVLKGEIYITNIPNPNKYGEIIQKFQPEMTPLIRKNK